MAFEKTKHGLTFGVLVQSPLGLHARPAARLAQEVQDFNVDVAVKCGTNFADGKSILDLLTLGAVSGSELIFYAQGEDANACLARIEELFYTEFKE